MSHQPFESWIVIRDELDAPQQVELEQHLAACEACRLLSDSWLAVEKQLAEVEILQPVDGFAKRWRMRFDDQQLARHKKQTSILLGLLSVGAAFLFLPLALQALLYILSPEDLLFEVIRDAMEWFEWLGFVGGLATTIVESLLDTVPPLAWAGFVLLISLLSSIWLIAVHQLNLRTQIERSTTR